MNSTATDQVDALLTSATAGIPLARNMSARRETRVGGCFFSAEDRGDFGMIVTLECLGRGVGPARRIWSVVRASNGRVEVVEGMQLFRAIGWVIEGHGDVAAAA